MECPGPEMDLMMRVTLNVPLFQKHEKELTVRSARTFLFDQEIIFDWLMENQDNFARYFRKFYENHKRLEIWANSQSQRSKDILQYRFTRLLQKPIAYYQEELQNRMKRRKRRRPKFSSTVNAHSPTKSSLSGLEQLFYYEQQCAQRQKWGRNRLLRHQNSDTPYQFYRKTFHACNGKKYISYDYQKHMAAQKIKRTYKMPQRLKHMVKMANMMDTGRVLKSSDINTTQKAQTIKKVLVSEELHSRTVNQSPISIRENKSKFKARKIVVVNHTGKPRSYNL